MMSPCSVEEFPSWASQKRAETLQTPSFTGNGGLTHPHQSDDVDDFEVPLTCMYGF
jgi:hypothetical protein